MRRCGGVDSSHAPLASYSYDSEVENTRAVLVDTVMEYNTTNSVGEGRYRRLTLHRPHQKSISSHYALALDDIYTAGRVGVTPTDIDAHCVAAGAYS